MLDFNLLCGPLDAAYAAARDLSNRMLASKARSISRTREAAATGRNETLRFDVPQSGSRVDEAIARGLGSRRGTDHTRGGLAHRDEEFPTPQEILGFVARIIGSALLLALIIELFLNNRLG